MADRSIRVLQVIPDLKKGGVQAEVMWPARLLDNKQVQFDVLLLSNTRGYYEDEFKKYGKVFRIYAPEHKNKLIRGISLFTNYFYYKKKMGELFKSHPPYDAIHAHHTTLNAPIISAAKKEGIPVRIAHCAVNKPVGKCQNRLHVRFYLKLCEAVLNKTATSKFGVTQNAADYVFGKDKGRMIKNPTLDLSKFNPSLYTRNNLEVLELLMVGSYSERKNQMFAIDILEKIVRSGQKCSLKMIGYPRSEKENYYENMKRRIAELKLGDYVEFLPQDSDIPYYMSQADFLLIPSLQEGLPNVALEAQAMGLPCIVSKDVSDDCDCGLCHFLSLDEGSGKWSDFIMHEFMKTKGQRQYVDMSEWDNRKVCEEYLEIWRGNKK